jgi:cell division control protein 6
MGWGNPYIQLIGISNKPFVFKDLDPRTKSRLYPLKEFNFSPYTKQELREIVKSRMDDAFSEWAFDWDVIDFLAEFTREKQGDVRVARETLIPAGETAIKSGDRKVTVEHLKENLNMTQYAKPISVIRNISERERFILKMIPEKGIVYPKFYRIFRQLNGSVGDRMLRNYMGRLEKLNLIKVEQNGVGGRQIISLNTPKDVLFDSV